MPGEEGIETVVTDGGQDNLDLSGADTGEQDTGLGASGADDGTGTGGGDQPPAFDYEKGYKELQRKFGDQGREVGQLRQQVEKLTTTRDTTPQPSRAHQIADRAIEDIGRIPQTDPDYGRKSARIWADAQKEIARESYTELSTEQKNTERLTSYIETTAMEGLKDVGMDEKRVIKLFWQMAADAPKNISLDEQIAWAVGETKSFIDNIVTAHADRQKTDEDMRRGNAVMGRGANRTGGKPGTGTAEDSGPKTLADAFRASKTARRVTSKQVGFGG